MRGKDYKMVAETGKFGPNKTRFVLTVETDPQGQLQLKTDIHGFSPYEVISFLDIVKQKMINEVQ